MADSNSVSATCAVCGEQNPAANVFCGHCGSKLDFSAAILRDQIKAVLKTELKDQKVLEIETTQQIAGRLTEWAKTFGFFAGALLAILLGTLAIWGWRSFSDIDSKIKKASGDAVAATEQRVQAAQQRAAALDVASQDLDKRYQKLREDAARYEALGHEVESLKQSVARIEKRNFEPSAALTPDLQKKLDSTLKGFQEYVARLGYSTKQSQINVLIAPDDRKMPNASAYYDKQNQRIWILKEAASDPGYILREYMFSVLYSAGEPADLSEKTWQTVAVASGLAYYFPASFLDNARTMDLDLASGAAWEPPASLTDALANRPKAWASICWQLRNSIDPAILDKALLNTWFELAPSRLEESAAVFAQHLLAKLGNQAGRAAEILKARGVKA